MEGAAQRTYHFRLHETGETWWALEIVNPCAAVSAGNHVIGDLVAHAGDRQSSYAVWRIPALGMEAEHEEDLVTEGWPEPDAVLPQRIDGEVMELAIEAIRRLDQEA